jgi:small subunit ribosomal protein S6
MYLLGSHVADTDVPAISQSVLQSVEEYGGTNVKESQLGKKKLAYPIKKTRNGHYVVVNFSMDPGKINQLDAKIRSQNQNIIRYIMVNLDEHLERKAKDEALAAKSPRRIPQPDAIPEKRVKVPPVLSARGGPILQEIDSATLDKKIEEALTEDITK